jgi:DNA polymerase-3 subunit epsilon/ATP-dependent DNA helicase DinG
MSQTYVALDLELTGLDRQRDEITEIGMVLFRDGEVLETFSSFVHTDRRISFKIEQLSGISQEDVRHAPTLGELRGQVLNFVRNHPIVGHSIETDLHYMRKQGLPLNNLALDTFELATILLPAAPNYALGTLAEMLGVPLNDAHRALADATATKDLFSTLVIRLQAWDLSTLEEITRLARATGWPMLTVLRDVLQERQARERSLLTGSADGIHQQHTVLRREPEWPPLEPVPTPTELDANELAALISAGGPFEAHMPNYEFRPQQVEMLRAVCEALSIPSHLLVEAGTGTGKSLAYLLPAIRFAVQNGRRVLISSNTINLQDQLYNKDLPDLQRILPDQFHSALLKGRANYICMRRLAAFRRARQMNVDDVRTLAKILAWLPQTESGDRTELLLIGDEQGAWSQVQSTPETCLGERCPYHRTGDCFFYRARGRAERAHIVIVNHALLLTDLQMEGRLLPAYDYVIIDEAHHLEEQATSQFGLDIGRQDVYSFLNGLMHSGEDTPGGLLSMVPGLMRQETVPQGVRDRVTDLLSGISQHIEAAERRLYELFNLIIEFLKEHEAGNGRTQNDYDQTTRVTAGLRAQPGWSAVEIGWENLAEELRPALRSLEQIIKLIDAVEGPPSPDREELSMALHTQHSQGLELLDGLDKILLSPADEDIYWISTARRTQEVALHSAPLHVGDLLQERLFEDKACVILTSATLTTNNNFDYIKERLGLSDVMQVALDSPFDYQSAVLLYVPKDIPEPNEPYYQRTVEQSLIDLVRATEGRALVLFTSNSQLQATYRASQGVLDRDGIVVFGQGIDGSRRQILENFRNTPNSVLMGTRSFWEGIDVMGEALSCLAITRLPFAVPSDPIILARAETFDDAFNQYYLPDTILRFRQGFGRLIRSKDDFGIVVVLDKRIITKPYGKTILRSLPGCTARQGPIASLPELARRWLNPTLRAVSDPKASR